MSEAAIQEVVQELLEGSGDLSEKDDCGLLHFLIQGLRSSNAGVAEAAAQGLLALLSRSQSNRSIIRASSAASAAKAMHFLRPELAALAQRLSDELELDPEGPEAPTHEMENWLSFTYTKAEPMAEPKAEPKADLVITLKIKLSEAREAELLSSHGWRVWPGAQVLASWMVSQPSFLVGQTVLEVQSCPLIRTLLGGIMESWSLSLEEFLGHGMGGRIY
ncbi:unnamed protein product [Symbiodinium natans]|uniref:Uncharacterized protein n=1 Tax=Symbiodinium natans TaxID=878477 RepID=A0A812IM84_9DINO|nr:unnamed protein product [Symbiodinium natans]